MVMTYIPSDATWHKNGWRVGISMVFEIIGHFLFYGGWDHHVRSWLIYHQVILETRNNTIYGQWWGSQRFSRYLSTYCLRGDRTTPMVMTYIPSHAPWHKDQEYVWLGVGISKVFFQKYLSTSCLRVDGTTPYGHDLHTIWFSLTQGRTYNV
jgi:hypothetical protein